MNEDSTPGGSENESIKITYQSPHEIWLFADITVFSALLASCFEIANNKIKKIRIQKLLAYEQWIEHYKDKSSGKRVLSESKTFEFSHEFDTARALARVGFHVIFAPKGLFRRSEKTFDVFLIKEHIILKADLKSISSKNPNTISNRIKEGAAQASRIVIDVISNVDKKDLIAGLRSGVSRGKNLKEIFLFYRNCFYILPKNLVESKRIYEVIK